MSRSLLRISDKEIASTESGYLAGLLLAFTEADRHEIGPSTGDDWGLYYQTSAGIARDRLDVLGYNFDVAHNVYDRELAAIKKELQNLEHEWAHDAEALLLLEVDGEWARSASFDSWLAAARDYLRSGEDTSTQPLAPVIFADLGEERPRHILGFPGSDALACLRALLELCPTSTPVTYDLSELVERGFIQPDEQLAEAARSSIGASYLPSRTIIVLTEGTTDAAVLSRSLQLLYPHLAEYFSFLDFDTFRVQGGAGSVLNFLKAFVGARVENRILAILDNDTAAHDARRSLSSITLPSRVRVLHYPDLPDLVSYPTLGPTGLAEMNVNGLAGSIELYLGEDVLRGPDGELAPVQWRGYNETLGRYQGEVTSKAELKDRFLGKLEACEADRRYIDKYDWSGIRAVLQVLRTAYTVPV